MTESKILEGKKAFILERQKRLEVDDSAPKCRSCGKPIVYLANNESLVQGHIYSQPGLSEARITGMCEFCYDEAVESSEENECTCDMPCCEVDIGIGIITCGSQHCRVHRG